MDRQLSRKEMIYVVRRSERTKNLREDGKTNSFFPWFPLNKSNGSPPQPRFPRNESKKILWKKRQGALKLVKVVFFYRARNLRSQAKRSLTTVDMFASWLWFAFALWVSHNRKTRWKKIGVIRPRANAQSTNTSPHDKKEGEKRRKTCMTLPFYLLLNIV